MSQRLRTRNDIDAEFLRELKRNLIKNNGIHIYEIRSKKKIFDIDPDTGRYDGFVFKKDNKIIFDSKKIRIHVSKDDPATKKTDNEIIVRDKLPFELCREIDEWQKDFNWQDSDEYYDPYSNIEMFIRYIAGEDLNVEINYYKNHHNFITLCLTEKSAKTFMAVNEKKYKNMYSKPYLLIENNELSQLTSILKRIEI